MGDIAAIGLYFLMTRQDDINEVDSLLFYSFTDSIRNCIDLLESMRVFD